MFCDSGSNYLFLFFLDPLYPTVSQILLFRHNPLAFPNILRLLGYVQNDAVSRSKFEQYSKSGKTIDRSEELL